MLIYIVDDEEAALFYLEEALRTARPNDEIITFDRPTKLLDAFNERPCDVAVLDIEMPTISGIEAAKKLLEKKPTLNIIFVTGYGEYAVDAFDICASGYLLKPCTAEQVTKAFANLRYQIEPAKKLFIKTFGNFDVFYNGEPLKFKSMHGKELLAYLVDREGATVTRAEVGAILFGDEYDRNKQSQLSHIISGLIEMFESIDVNDFLVIDNGYSVRLANAECDFIECLNGNDKYKFLGEYMEQYSWAEVKKSNLSSVV